MSATVAKHYYFRMEKYTWMHTWISHGKVHMLWPSDLQKPANEVKEGPQRNKVNYKNYKNCKIKITEFCKAINENDQEMQIK